MRRFFVELAEDKARALVDLAWSERRRPQDQAALLIEYGLPSDPCAAIAGAGGYQEADHESV